MYCTWMRLDTRLVEKVISLMIQGLRYVMKWSLEFWVVWRRPGIERSGKRMMLG